MHPLTVVAATLLSGSSPVADPLTAQVTALDAKVFAAYNRCDLVEFARYFDLQVAFFHDTGRDV